MIDAHAGSLLRIFIGEDDRYHGRPLYMAVVDELRAAGFAGASVFKGVEGFGSHKVVHAGRFIDVASNLPVLIEVIEEEAKIFTLLPRLREMIDEGLLTLENLSAVALKREPE